MYFSNPAIIENFNDVKLAMVETDATEMSFIELMACVRYRLERLIGEEVNEITKKGNVSREDAIKGITIRAHELIRFWDNGVPEDEEALAKAIMNSLTFENWESGIWTRFQQTHPAKIKKSTPIPTQGILKMKEDALTEALDELTLQGVLEVLVKYN